MATTALDNPDASTDTSDQPLVVLAITSNDDSNVDATIISDATISEQHNESNTVTDHPVEEGVPVTDHSRPNPDRPTFECYISNSPVDPTQQSRAVQQAGFTFQSSSANNSKVGATQGYAQQAYEKLRKLRLQGTLLTVVSTVRTYKSMVIESISIPVSTWDKDALHFTITFKQIRVVKNKLTTTSANPRVANVKKGKQVPKKPDAGEETSPLFKLAESASQSSNGTISAGGNYLLGGGQ